MKTGQLFLTSAVLTVLAATTVFAGTWVQDTARPENENGRSNWWYQNDDGSYPADGWEWIDGDGDGWAADYCFDEEGWMYADTKTPDGYLVDVSGAWLSNGMPERKWVGEDSPTVRDFQVLDRFFQDSDSPEIPENQWYHDGYGNLYLDGKGELVFGWKKIDGKQYYFDGSGYMATGYRRLSEGDYYFLNDGELSEATVFDPSEGRYYVVDKRRYQVIDIVGEEDWDEYKKKADSSGQLSRIVSPWGT